MKTKAPFTLANLSDLLEKLAENANSVYWLSTPDLKHIAYLSPAYESIWGRAREALYADPEQWISYLHPDDGLSRHPIHEMAERIAQCGSQAQFSEVYRIIRPNGEIRWIVDRGFPIFDNQGRCHGVTGVAMDMTKEKHHEAELSLAKEKAERANAAKSALIANMSHDVRTPLAGMLGLTEELIEAANTVKPQQLVKKIKEEGHYLFDAANALLNLFNAILESILVESGQRITTAKPFNLSHLIEALIKLLWPVAQQKKLQLTYHIAKEIPVMFYGLAPHLERILLNLLSKVL